MRYEASIDRTAAARAKYLRRRETADDAPLMPNGAVAGFFTELSIGSESEK